MTKIILLDLQQTMIGSLMADMMTQGTEMNEQVLKFRIFNTIRAYKNNFKSEYGDITLCCDSPRTWRKTHFPYYKANRKKAREESGFDWNLVYKTFDECKGAIRDIFGYRIIELEGVEADDIIGTLVPYIHSVNAEEPILIVSSDKDFYQLHKWKNVYQYSPLTKLVTRYDKPEEYLIEHIIKGDKNDGIPNVLSDSDTFVTEGKRQKPVSKELLDRNKANLNFEEMPYFLRNKSLIDLSEVPPYIMNQIIDEYEKPLNNQVKKSEILDFFIKNKIPKLIEHIGEF